LSINRLASRRIQVIRRVLDNADRFALEITLELMSFALVLKGEKHAVKAHCCDVMTEQVNLVYPQAAGPLLGSTDKRVYWSSAFDEYGLICQPSAEVLVISHCPFCGVALPASKRDRWVEALEARGWRTWGDSIPEDFLSNAWREL